MSSGKSAMRSGKTECPAKKCEMAKNGHIFLLIKVNFPFSGGKAKGVSKLSTR